MKKIFNYVGIVVVVMAAGFFVAGAWSADAANLNYGKIVSVSGNSALIQYKGIGTEAYYLCSIVPAECQKTTSSAPLAPDPTAATSTLVTRGLSQAFSPNLRYQAKFNASTPTKPERTFTIFDTTANKTYTKKSTVGYWDLLSEGITTFSFSPDNKSLVYLDDSAGYQSLYLVDLTKLTGTTFTSKQIILRKYTVVDFIFWDGDTIYFTANRDSLYNWALYKMSIKNQTAVKVADGTSYNQAMYRSGNNLIFLQIHSTSVDPMIYNTLTGTLTAFPITPPNAPFPKSGTDEVVTFGADHGVLMKPVTQAPGAPLLVWLHGGPFREASLGYHSYLSYGEYDWILEALRNAGVTVLKLDYPGSFGFGRAYAESIKDNVGLTDVGAVMNAVRTIQTKTGTKSVSLVGNSYGGYLALRALVQSPQTFAGAFSINGVTDWQALHERVPYSIFTLHFGGAETLTNLSLYNQASIFNLIHNLGAQKIVLTHGNADSDIPYWQSQMLADNLKSIGKSVDFVTYEGENHIYTKKETFTDLCKRLFAFEGLQAGTACDIN